MSQIFSLANARIKNLRYFIFSGNQSPPEFKNYHNSAYQLWKAIWNQTFLELKSDAKLRADDFVRQDMIGALFYGEKAVGMLLHTYLNLELDATKEHQYLSSFPPEIIAQLIQSGSKEVMSMEYLTLDPDWRKSSVGVSLSEVILGLGVKLADATGYESSIMVTRNEKKVNQMLYGFGCHCLKPKLTKHNVEVDLVTLRKGSSHQGPNSEINELIEFFWKNRIDVGTLQRLPYSERLEIAA